MSILSDRLAPADVRAAVEAAPIPELAAALIEPTAFGDGPALTGESLACPRCQATPGAFLIPGPRAWVVSQVAWCCYRCGLATRWALVHRVLESPGALERILAAVPAPA